MSFSVNGKYSDAYVFTNLCESEAVSQIINLMNQPMATGSHARFMPDVHAGAGCVVGTTMHVTDKIVPNLVGVDIGCLDKDTEILTPNGWIKISNYNNQKILTYDASSDVAFFEHPNAFIKNPCDKFYHLYNTKNLDQMVSSEHHMLVYQGYKNRGFKLHHYTAEELVGVISKVKKADNYNVKTTFNINNIGVPYTDNEIRIFVMISADARIKSLKNGNTYIELHFKKQRKIDRAKELLNNSGVEYHESYYKDGSVCISFSSSLFNTKDLSQFFYSSTHQLKIICDEVFYWDGSIDKKRNHRNYYTVNKTNADLIQFAFNSTGIRSEICTIEYKNNPNWSIGYVVTPTKNEYVSYRTNMIEAVLSEDGYKYCFNTKTGAFIARRNNHIFVTGNCGMEVVYIKERNLDFKELDEMLHDGLFVPSGFNKRDVVHPYIRYCHLEDLYCKEHVDMDNADHSLGSLGGGNHFIEIDVDKNGQYILVVHSGSRHLGVEVCKYYQNLAIKNLHSKTVERDRIIATLKSQGRQSEIQGELAKLREKAPRTPNDLAYLEGEDFEHYLHDMKIVQEFAKWSRKAMAESIMDYMGWHVADGGFTTIHNYIDVDNRILRKGAISAQNGEKVIIPLSMKDGSIIAVGKGNPEWNYSAPHGAGRIMSRSQAKATLSIDDFAHEMEGIYTTCVCAGTIDESPMAYKPPEAIVENIKDTVDIIEIIKPVYNFKAS